MTDQVERVRDLVRRALVTNPSVTNRELYDRAMEVAPEAVKDLTLLQFHARFRLPIIRNEMVNRPDRKAGEKPARRPRRRPAPRPAGSIRADLRELLVRFAMELEAAGNRSDLIRVVAGMDKVIDEILVLTRRPELPEHPAAERVDTTPSPEPHVEAEPEAKQPLAAAAIRRPPELGRSLPPTRPAPSEHRWPPRPPNPFREP